MGSDKPTAPATLPPSDLELAHVSAFEYTIKHTSENEARLARLYELLSWSVDGSTE